MAQPAKKQDKVRVVIDCSIEQRSIIKMLAARHRMSISEYFLAKVQEEIQNKMPNKETLEAIREVNEEGGIPSASLEDFWKKMGMNPNA